MYQKSKKRVTYNLERRKYYSRIIFSSPIKRSNGPSEHIDLSSMKAVAQR
jgi:hypothetical protein